MIPVLSRDQVRALDAHATAACAVPSLLLMENAGRGAAEIIRRRLGASRGAVIVCGPGNNGGDGFVVARRLLTIGHAATVALCINPDRLKGDARVNHLAWLGVGGRVVDVSDGSLLNALDTLLAESDLIVDALLGTGVDRPVTGHFAEVIERMNRAPVARVALDVPSGLDADTGAVLGVAVRAERTITFAHPKLGLLTSSGANHAGELHVADIGVPAALSAVVGEAAELIESRDVAGWIAPRPPATHKGTAGRVLAVAGSPGKTGAALLVARGALRAGAGLVTIGSSQRAVDALDRRVLEEMTACIDADRPEASLDDLLAKVDVVAIGPGLGQDAWAGRVIDHVVLRWPGTKVVDADAISHFRDRGAALAKASGRLVLTPHPAELARLLGGSAQDVEVDRFGALERAVHLTGAVVVLKGRHTLIGAPGHLPIVNASGCPALATAGAGDVLSGITAALCCHLEPRRAAAAAVHLHGLSAERWQARTRGDRGLMAHEVADGVVDALAELSAAPDVLTS